MALRDIHDDIITALQNREPLLSYHLVKFEKPSNLNKSGRRTDFVYLTDALKKNPEVQTTKAFTDYAVKNQDIFKS